MNHHAVDTQEAPQQIISSCVQGLSPAAAAQILELNTVQWVIPHQRQQAYNPVPLPLDLAAMEVSDEYCMTVTSELFLQADLGGQACLLLFASPDAIQVLCQSDHWCVDGIFKPAMTSSTRCTSSMSSSLCLCLAR